MNVPAPRPNPYQPPPASDAEFDPTTPLRVAFALNDRLRRHAEAQYLLHWHPTLLLYSSLAMIIVSCIVMFIATHYGVPVFLATLGLVMAVTASIYTALVRRSKRRIRLTQEAHGMTRDEMIEIVSDPQQLTLVTPLGTYQWSNGRQKIHRTWQGLLICPEPYFFVFVPKRAGFPGQTYDQFVSLLRSRGGPDTVR